MPAALGDSSTPPVRFFGVIQTPSSRRGDTHSPGVFGEMGNAAPGDSNTPPARSCGVVNSPGVFGDVQVPPARLFGVIQDPRCQRNFFSVTHGRGTIDQPARLFGEIEHPFGDIQQPPARAFGVTDSPGALGDMGTGPARRCGIMQNPAVLTFGVIGNPGAAGDMHIPARAFGVIQTPTVFVFGVMGTGAVRQFGVMQDPGFGEIHTGPRCLGVIVHTVGVTPFPGGPMESPGTLRFGVIETVPFAGDIPTTPARRCGVMQNPAGQIGTDSKGDIREPAIGDTPLPGGLIEHPFGDIPFPARQFGVIEIIPCRGHTPLPGVFGTIETGPCRGVIVFTSGVVIHTAGDFPFPVSDINQPVGDTPFPAL